MDLNETKDSSSSSSNLCIEEASLNLGSENSVKPKKTKTLLAAPSKSFVLGQGSLFSRIGYALKTGKDIFDESDEEDDPPATSTSLFSSMPTVEKSGDSSGSSLKFQFKADDPILTMTRQINIGTPAIGLGSKVKVAQMTSQGAKSSNSRYNSAIEELKKKEAEMMIRKKKLEQEDAKIQQEMARLAEEERHAEEMRKREEEAIKKKVKRQEINSNTDQNLKWELEILKLEKKVVEKEKVIAEKNAEIAEKNALINGLSIRLKQACEENKGFKEKLNLANQDDKKDAKSRLGKRPTLSISSRLGDKTDEKKMEERTDKRKERFGITEQVCSWETQKRKKFQPLPDELVLTELTDEGPVKKENFKGIKEDEYSAEDEYGFDEIYLPLEDILTQFGENGPVPAKKFK